MASIPRQPESLAKQLRSIVKRINAADSHFNRDPQTQTPKSERDNAKFALETAEALVQFFALVKSDPQVRQSFNWLRTIFVRATDVGTRFSALFDSARPIFLREQARKVPRKDDNGDREANRVDLSLKAEFMEKPRQYRAELERVAGYYNKRLTTPKTVLKDGIATRSGRSSMEPVWPLSDGERQLLQDLLAEIDQIEVRVAPYRVVFDCGIGALENWTLTDFRLMFPDPWRECISDFGAAVQLVHDHILRPAATLQATSNGPKERKRSTQKGEAKQKLISALVAHHKYDGVVCEKRDSVSVRELAEAAEVAPASASRFFQKQFPDGGHKRYKNLCIRDFRRVEQFLKLISGETVLADVRSLDDDFGHR